MDFWGNNTIGFGQQFDQRKKVGPYDENSFLDALNGFYSGGGLLQNLSPSPQQNNKDISGEDRRNQVNEFENKAGAFGGQVGAFGSNAAPMQPTPVQQKNKESDEDIFMKKINSIGSSIGGF